MALRILWTQTAVRERNAILDFFRNRNGSPRYSQELLRHFRDSLRLAANHELLGKPTDAPGVRCLFVVDYSLFYSARSGELAVLSVWDNRRDPEDRPY
jgi:plasmid stabilization system protein ParE